MASDTLFLLLVFLLLVLLLVAALLLVLFLVAALLLVVRLLDTLMLGGAGFGELALGARVQSVLVLLRWHGEYGGSSGNEKNKREELHPVYTMSVPYPAGLT